MTYAFSFDAGACTGCKACQAACKDKNNLPVGVLWRRVIEVSGGEWNRIGNAWSNTVFAYNLSLACNHCVHPKCAGVCPVDAYSVRPDGIVILDSAKCAGCGYCNWACPYAVPQYNQAAGVMGKCNFCIDDLEQGSPPACVAACPLRVLDYKEVQEAEPPQAGLLALWELPGAQHPFPLPEYSRTQPHLLLKPHQAMSNMLVKRVGNHEELRPMHPKSELPLVAFTLLVQISVGAFWASLWLFGPAWITVPGYMSSLRLVAALLSGLPLALGGLISFTHLGNRGNSWRMLNNLRKSWLSREVLFGGLYAAGWLLSLLWPGPFSFILTALLGLGLIRAMASVYRLRSMKAWNTWRTLASFMLSALLLGQFLSVLAESIVDGVLGVHQSAAVLIGINSISAVLLLGQHLVTYVLTGPPSKRSAELRNGLTVSMLAILAGLPLLPGLIAKPLPYALLFMLLLVQQVSGRMQFYDELENRQL